MPVLRRKKKKAVRNQARQATKRIAPQFRPEDQLIFTYHNGEHLVEADPIALHCALLETPDFLADVKLSMLTAEMAAVEASKAYRRVIITLRRVFGIKEFKSEMVGGKLRRSGMVDANVRLVLDQFVAFVEDLKKKAGISPTPSTPSQEPALDANSPTPSSLASTSTETASWPSEPCPQPSVSQSLSEEKPLEAFGTL